MLGTATSEREKARSELPFVTATLNYSAETPRARAYVLTPEKNHRPLAPTGVKIYDARPIRGELDLEKEGFALLDHRSSVTHLRTPQDIDSIYHQEVGKLIREISGADFVLPYRKYMQLRLSQRAPGENGNEFTRPAGFVHMDFSHRSFLDFVRFVQEAEGVTPGVYRRVVVYQTWRALSPPPQDFPLAVTDGRSVKPNNHIIMDNIISSEEDGADNVLETRLGRADPDDRWYYFSNMRVHELLVFKGNGTGPSDTQNVLHTGFDNTVAEPNAIPRESLEARFFAFWR
jgi:hypothetical protein